MPSLLIEPNELAPNLCWLLGHEKSPIAYSTGDNIHSMPRTYLIFGDIEGKLDVLRVEKRVPNENLMNAASARAKVVIECTG